VIITDAGMALGPIKRETYIKFILNWLKKGGYVVSAKEGMRQPSIVSS
jgi:hypothetical protein